MRYPEVTDERATLELVCSGQSIARYGDGEFKLCRGGAIKSQAYEPALAARLRAILHASGQCLVGIPNIRSDTPKADFWGKYMGAARFLAERPYVSAFITRPDSAPWIDTPKYWAHLFSLWKGQDVTLVRGSGKSLTADRLIEWGAGAVTEIIAPRQHAWADYDSLIERIGTPTRALLCLGPTATVMAVDLCAKGVHAIDLGHVGLFAKKHVNGEPMWLSKTDKTPEAVAV